MNTIEEISCLCCNKESWSFIESTEGGDYLMCKHCGYQFQYSSDKQKCFEREQNKFYNEESICLSPLFFLLQEKAVLKRVELVKKFIPKNGSLLEVGPGTGDVLYHLLSTGYEVEAVEHSKILAKKIKSRLDVDIRIGAFENEYFDNTLYDAYMSFHVIEHVVDVLSHLQKANSIVKKGGYAFIATPNADSWEHKLPFALSPNFSTAHLQLFSKNSLAHCLEKTGWKIVDIQTPEYTSSWLRVFTGILRKIKGKNIHSQRGEYMKSAGRGVSILVKCFSIVSYPLRFIQKRMKKGNELLIVAVKIR